MKNDIKKKKVLHVIHIVYDILSALFILFTSTILIIYGATRSDEKTQDILTPNVQEVEKKSKRNTIYSNNDNLKMFYIPIETLMFNEDFTLRLFDRLADNGSQWYEDFFYHTTSGWNAYTVNRQYFVPFMDKNYETGNTFYKFNYSSGLFRPASEYPSTLNPNSSGISITTVESSTYYHGYDIRIINDGNPSLDNPGGTILYYRVYLRRFANANGTTSGGFSCVVQTFDSDYGTAFSSIKDYYISAREGDILYTVIDSLQTGEYQVGYNEGYDVGYQVGHSDGYQESESEMQTRIDTAYQNGYGTGYNVGIIDGSEGVESNAFTVIGQAFNAVNSIFSIEILPNLPLWVLVFTPLIIAVVIVVVKLIKG